MEVFYLESQPKDYNMREKRGITMTTKRNYWTNVNRQLAKKCAIPCEMTKDQFYQIFHEDFDRKLPGLIPFLSSLDVRIDTMGELYDWAFYGRNIIKWYPGDQIVIGYYEDKNFHSVDSINLCA